ncbi:MAG: PKD domain-containing protein, partial [Thermoanaerobaculia bacterium]
WRDVNPAPNVWDFNGVNGVVTAAQSQGLQVLAVLSTAPEWAGGGPLGTVPPGNVGLWREFVRRTAAQFAGRIAAYEIWNEPNLRDIGIHGVGWDRPLDAAPFYTDYLVAAAQEIRAAAPGTLVVGPVSSSEPNDRTETLYQQLETRGASPFVDVVSFHANGAGRVFSEVRANIDRSLSILNSRNPSNAGKPIWITEFGWFGGSAGREGVGGEVAQRDLIQRLVERMAGAYGCISPIGFAVEPDNGWSEHAITHAFIYTLIDLEDDPSGVYRADHSPKRVVTEYLRALSFPARQTSEPWHVAVTPSCSGTTCTFAAGSVELAGGPVQPVYHWFFGDGSRGEAAGASISHTFPRPGRYFVRLGVEERTTHISLGGSVILVRVGGSAQAGEPSQRPSPVVSVRRPAEATAAAVPTAAAVTRPPRSPR